MSEILYINEDKVKELLDLDLSFQAMESAITSVSQKRVNQNPRTFTKCSKTDSLLLTMPCYLDNANFGAFGCKLVTIAPNNANLEKPLPTINGNVVLFDEETGMLKAIVAATEITKWRTAVTSAVATKYLMASKNYDILAILGAGTQGEAHAITFHHFFGFKEVRLWNRSTTKAQKLAEQLNTRFNTTKFKHFESNKECVRNADVIVTATFSKEAIVELEWLKENSHINAVGAGVTHHSELSESIYLSRNVNVYIDHWSGAETELSGLRKLGVEFKGEIGSLITGDLTPPPLNQLTVFQSLGMAVEDCAMARVIYDLYKKQSENC